MMRELKTWLFASPADRSTNKNLLLAGLRTQEAVDLYGRAIDECGDLDAMVMLGKLLETRVEGVARVVLEAFRCFE